MSAAAIQAALSDLSYGHSLDRASTRALFTAIMSGEATEAQIGAVLMGLRVKGETSDELTGAVEAMRDLSMKVAVNADHLVDTCGTGSSTSGSLGSTRLS